MHALLDIVFVLGLHCPAEDKLPILERATGSDLDTVCCTPKKILVQELLEVVPEFGNGSDKGGSIIRTGNADIAGDTIFVQYVHVSTRFDIVDASVMRVSLCMISFIAPHLTAARSAPTSRWFPV